MKDSLASEMMTAKHFPEYACFTVEHHALPWHLRDIQYMDPYILYKIDLDESDAYAENVATDYDSAKEQWYGLAPYCSATVRTPWKSMHYVLRSPYDVSIAMHYFREGPTCGPFCFLDTGVFTIQAIVFFHSQTGIIMAWKDIGE